MISGRDIEAKIDELTIELDEGGDYRDLTSKIEALEWVLEYGDII